MKAARTKNLINAHAPYEAFWEGFASSTINTGNTGIPTTTCKTGWSKLRLAAEAKKPPYALGQPADSEQSALSVRTGEIA